MTGVSITAKVHVEHVYEDAPLMQSLMKDMINSAASAMKMRQSKNTIRPILTAADTPSDVGFARPKYRAETSAQRFNFSSYLHKRTEV